MTTIKPVLECDLEIPQGADIALVMRIDDDGTPVNWTGFTGAAQVKDAYTSTSPLITFTVAHGGTAGTITLTAARSQTENLTCPIAGVWDLEMTSAGNARQRVMQGDVTITPQVTP